MILRGKVCFPRVGTFLFYYLPSASPALDYTFTGARKQAAKSAVKIKNGSLVIHTLVQKSTSKAPGPLSQQSTRRASIACIPPHIR